MLTRQREPLSRWTTLRLGGPATRLVEATDRTELYDLVQEADAGAEPVLLVGGGSNLVVADEGFQGTAVRVTTRGVLPESTPRSSSSPRAVLVSVEAGEDWDRFVERAVGEGWSGIEAMSGIPGTVGAVPIQNVGAYGQEVSDTVVAVDVFDRRDRQPKTLSSAECEFGYRTSLFKRNPDRYVVGSVTFALEPTDDSAPIHYPELAARLGCDVDGRAPLGDVRAAVLALRRGKGMVLDAADHDTWSVGSFFTNPIVPADQIPPDAPAWSQPDGLVKTSAAWLIVHAGFDRGYGDDSVKLSEKHPLALTNRGHATTAELIALARTLRDGVQERFGIALAVEPTLVGCSL